MMKWRDPVDGRIFWEPPGGGIEPGETSRDAAARELYEETGLGLKISSRSTLVARDYRWAGRRHVHLEEFFLAEGHAGAVRLQMPTDEERATFLELRFVDLTSLGLLDAPLEPPTLGAVLQNLFETVP